ncbi:Nif3-like dinuclear metal center hexameric protein, partial [Staphylococcus saprophyticus]
HYSEYVMKEGLCELLVDWLNNETEDFKIIASKLNTDPFNYL